MIKNNWRETAKLFSNPNLFLFHHQNIDKIKISTQFLFYFSIQIKILIASCVTSHLLLRIKTVRAFVDDVQNFAMNPFY